MSWGYFSLPCVSREQSSGLTLLIVLITDEGSYYTYVYFTEEAQTFVSELILIVSGSGKHKAVTKETENQNS